MKQVASRSYMNLVTVLRTDTQLKMKTSANNCQDYIRSSQGRTSTCGCDIPFLPQLLQVPTSWCLLQHTAITIICIFPWPVSIQILVFLKVCLHHSMPLGRETSCGKHFLAKKRTEGMRWCLLHRLPIFHSNVQHAAYYTMMPPPNW